MAKKKITNNATPKNTFEAIQKQAENFNSEVLTATDNLVDGSVKTVKQWQDLLAKVLNNGTEMLERQQNFSIDVLENVVNQTKSSGKRAKELVNFDFDFKNIWTKNVDKVSVKNITGKAKEIAEDVIEKGTKAFDKAKKTTDKVVKKSTKAAAKAKKVTTKKTNKVASKAKKRVKKATA